MFDKLKDPFAFIIFGASGDLSRRKLIPALYHLANLGYLPDRYAIIGTARTPMSDDQFRNAVRDAIQEHSKEDKPEGSVNAEKLLPSVYYQAGDTTKPDSFLTLKAKIDALDKDLGLQGNRLF